MDSRGVHRGSCSCCGCDGYDGGAAGMKCIYCGHPPGKHQNLSTDGSVSMKTSDDSSLSSTTFSIGPVCQYPGCGKQVYFDLNTSDEYPTCKDHLGIGMSDSLLVAGGLGGAVDSDSVFQSPSSSTPSLSSSNGGLSSSMFSGYFDQSSHSQLLPAASQHQSSLSIPTKQPRLQPSAAAFTDSLSFQPTVPLPPPGQRCKVQGCTRPRYQEPGPHGKLHKFCGRTHALEYNRKQAQLAGNINPLLKCKTPGCPRQKRPFDEGTGYFDFCSTWCRDGTQSLTSVSAPNLTPSVNVGTCSLPGCNRPKYQDPANNRVHDYCGRSHASQAQQQGIVVNPPDSTPIGIRQASPQELASVQLKFQQTWVKGSCRPLHCVFVVTNQSLLARWQTYRSTLSNQNTEEHYHGTKITCNIVNTQALCSNQDCGACGISSMGFDRRCIRKNINFQRFGHGFYLASNSSKCHDYTQGFNGFRVMLLCDVCPGKKYALQRDNQKLTSPPLGYDSVHGQTGGSLNYEEIVLYNPDAILPKYIIVYQKDGIQKIAT